MRKNLLTFAAIGMLATATMTACDSSAQTTAASTSTTTIGKGDGKARVGVIMPDTKSAQRWTTDDPKYLKQAFAAANVPVEIENAQGDRAAFVKIAQNMVDSGAKVLIIANLDSDSGKAALQAAQAKKVPTIDYDRLTLNGGADYYVSFNGVEVGRQQAFGLQKCLEAKHATNPVIADLNGSPTDNNATLFKSGYDSVLQDSYDNATYTKGPDQSVPDWDNDEGGVIFAQMLGQRPDIGGVLAANDGLAGAVIKVLKKHGLNGKVPVTGQDATVAGLQAVLVGDQCVTIYKAIKPEAQAAAGVAIKLFKGEKPQLPADAKIKDPESGAYVPFISLTPIAIDKAKVKYVVDEGFAAKKDLCTAPYAQACKNADIS